jgi:hypothetical protein
MNTENDNNAYLRAGLRRVIPPWEFCHLRVWAGARMAGGSVLAVLGFVTLGFGGNDGKTYAWAAAFLALAALAFAAGCWEMTIARSAAPGSERHRPSGVATP